jgi:hypothetical protein
MGSLAWLLKQLAVHAWSQLIAIETVWVDLSTLMLIPIYGHELGVYMSGEH